MRERQEMPKNSPPYDTLRQLLTDARVAAGLTQQALADKLGKHQSFIGKIESGARNIDVVEFIEVARVLDVEPTKLLGKLIKAAGL